MAATGVFALLVWTPPLAAQPSEASEDGRAEVAPAGDATDREDAGEPATADAAESVPAANEPDREDADGDATPKQGGRLVLPDPIPIARAPHERAGDWDDFTDEDEDDRYYTVPRHPVVFGLRGAPGLGLRVSGEVAPTFIFDALGWVRLAVTRGYTYWALQPELGYALAMGDGIEHHQLNAGIGVVRGFDEVSAVGWFPRFVIDPSTDELGLGLRNSLWITLFDIVAAELGHQWVQHPSGAIHDLRLTVSLDPMVVIYRSAKGEGLDEP